MRFFFIITVLFVFVRSIAEADEIRFGSIATLTGYGAEWGKHARQGMELARSEINRSGGIQGQPIRIIYEDFGELDLPRALGAAKKLIEKDRVVALLNFVVEDSEVIGPYIDQRKVISIAVAAGGERLTQTSEPRFLFRSTSSDTDLYRALVNYSLPKGRRACFFVGQSTYFEPMAQITKDFWESQGGTVVGTDSVPIAHQDYRSIITRYLKAGCETAFAFVSMNAQAALFKQLRTARFQGTIIGQSVSDDPSVIEAAGDAADGVLFAKHGDGSSQFTQSYLDQYGEAPQRPAATAYDAVRLLAHVIGKVGTDSEKMRSALLAVDQLPGASGPITIKSNQKRIGEVPILYTIKNGRRNELSREEAFLQQR